MTTLLTEETRGGKLSFKFSDNMQAIVIAIKTYDLIVNLYSLIIKKLLLCYF